MANTAKIETPKAVINGLIPINKPKAMPPKAVCESPSPIMASFFRIKNKPTNPQTIATMMPPMRAFWKNWYPKRLSRLALVCKNSFAVVLVKNKVEMVAVCTFKQLVSV